VVADFGIAHFEEDELYTAVATRDTARMANFQYAAPEPITRGAVVDHRADVFALGRLLNQMFTGAVPHGTVIWRLLLAPQYAYLDALVAAMISQAPGGRPSSIARVKDELIGRGNDFVHQQMLGTPTQTVVADSDIDDSLVLNPIELRRCDYREGDIIFYLSQPVNDVWCDVFRTFGGWEYLFLKIT
jgi:hypothetical protein